MLLVKFKVLNVFVQFIVQALAGVEVIFTIQYVRLLKANTDALPLMFIVEVPASNEPPKPIGFVVPEMFIMEDLRNVDDVELLPNVLAVTL